MILISSLLMDAHLPTICQNIYSSYRKSGNRSYLCQKVDSSLKRWYDIPFKKENVGFFFLRKRSSGSHLKKVTNDYYWVYFKSYNSS